jgi:hypothetical protein
VVRLEGVGNRLAGGGVYVTYFAVDSQHGALAKRAAVRLASGQSLFNVILATKQRSNISYISIEI